MGSLQDKCFVLGRECSACDDLKRSYCREENWRKRHIHILGLEVDLPAMEVIAGEYINKKAACEKICLLLSPVCKLVSF